MIISQSSGNSDVKMNGRTYEEKQLFHYLGVQIDSKLSFTHHFTKYESSLSSFCMYYGLRKILGKDHSLKAYNPYLNSILQYGSWLMCQQTKLN